LKKRVGDNGFERNASVPENTVIVVVEADFIGFMAFI